MTNHKLTSEQEELVINNVKFVYYLLNKYFSPTPTVKANYEELIQAGMIGLVKSAKNFDSKKGMKFTTFASTCIFNEIAMLLRNINKHSQYYSHSLNEAVPNSDDKLEFVDAIPDKSLDIDRMTGLKDEICQALSYVLSNFKLQAQAIIFYDLGGLIQNEIAEKVGISQSYTSRVLNNSRKKIINNMNSFIPNPSAGVFYIHDDLYCIRINSIHSSFGAFKNLFDSIDNYDSSCLDVIITETAIFIYFKIYMYEFIKIADCMLACAKKTEV